MGLLREHSQPESGPIPGWACSRLRFPLHIHFCALSPTVNDPTTGVLCIKYLQAIFEHLVHYSPYRFASGTSSLEIHLPPFEEYLEVFAELALYAGGNMRVIHAFQSALTGVKGGATTRALAALAPIKEPL